MLDIHSIWFIVIRLLLYKRNSEKSEFYIGHWQKFDFYYIGFITELFTKVFEHYFAEKFKNSKIKEKNLYACRK